MNEEENREKPEADAAFSASGDDSAAMEARFKEKEKEFKELYDRYVRTLADFENFKKRTAKEQIDFSKFASEKLLREFLPVLDNLDRAIAHSRETEDAGKLIEGVDLIRKQFLDVLSKFGVTVLESLGQPFDPHRHQAVGQVETDEEENRVVREAQKGYFLHDRLLRPSMVVVSKGRAQTRENDSSAPESRAGENSSGSERRGGPNG